ncbi:DUF2207 family protein, partial [Methanoregula sp.]|uniref:DUF2207 family protein n=1 Tax=Methanoregula sp. TaxID=2052170 RepID=UPI003C4E05F1
MSEIKQVAVLVIATLLIGIIGLAAILTIPPLLQGDLVASSYGAVLYPNGTLHEQYTYTVDTSGEYRMLYRSWEAPLTFTAANQSSIQLVAIDAPAGTIGYAKDYSGNVFLSTPGQSSSVSDQVGYLADTDEVGIYDPDYFAAGTYTVGYTYTIHPPIEYDSANDHLNLLLAGGSHIPYQSVQITIPATGVTQVYAYPPSLTTEKTGDTYTLSGSAAADENVAVEVLTTPGGLGQIPGFRSNVEGLAGSTASGSFWYDLPYYVAWFLLYLGMAAVILTPFVLLFIYQRYGREKTFVVPAYLSTIPDPSKKPWQVNLLFKGDAMEFDKDGFYATLLDLHRRKIIAITEKGGGKSIEIRKLSAATTDPYELRVLAFIDQLSENGVLDTAKFGELTAQAQSGYASQEKALRFQANLADITSRADAALPFKYVVDGRDHILPLLFTSVVAFGTTVIIALVASMQSSILYPAVVLWGIVAVQAFLAFSTPPALFGHWTDDHYKEKLEWDSFAHFLSDMAMIQKYAPSDLSMWGDWLVYGTALGVGEKVENAMKSLNIHIAE